MFRAAIADWIQLSIARKGDKEYRNCTIKILLKIFFSMIFSYFSQILQNGFTVFHRDFTGRFRGHQSLSGRFTGAVQGRIGAALRQGVTMRDPSERHTDHRGSQGLLL